MFVVDIPFGKCPSDPLNDATLDLAFACRWVDCPSDILGGDDVDHRLMDWLIEEFKRECGMDVSKDKMVLQRLKDAA